MSTNTAGRSNRSRAEVWAWLCDPATFTDGQIPPFRVEFLRNTSGETGFAPGVYNAHVGPLMSFSGVLGEIEPEAYRDLQYFYGSYAVSHALFRPDAAAVLARRREAPRHVDADAAARHVRTRSGARCLAPTDGSVLEAVRQLGRAGHPEQLAALTGTGHTRAMSTPFTDDEVAAVRDATPGCTDDLVHLNHCGSSLPPQVVLDTQVRHLRREAMIGGYEAADEAADREAAVYESIASMLGAQAHEIARAEHATAAWNAAFWSIPMRAGQRIITHDHDYGATGSASSALPRCTAW